MAVGERSETRWRTAEMSEGSQARAGQAENSARKEARSRTDQPKVVGKERPRQPKIKVA